MRAIDDDERQRLPRIVRPGSGSVVTWRRAQMVLLPAQGLDVAAIATVAVTSQDRVRDVIGTFNADGFGSLYPTYKAGRPPRFTLGWWRGIKKIAKSKPADPDLPLSTWKDPTAARSGAVDELVDSTDALGRTEFLRAAIAAASPPAGSHASA